jgi:hypothetical protein
MMPRLLCLCISITFVISGCSPVSAPTPPSNENTTSFALERAKAQRNPYANDFGPTTVDVSSYPPDIQAAYKDILQVKCQRCHTAARPLNSQYVEPFGPKSEHDAKIAKWKKEMPEIFKDRWVWQIEGAAGAKGGVWEQYVRKMSAKPGCDIDRDQQREVWRFLTYDSEHRKTGANAAAWAAHRRKLLADFKKSHPDRYRELYETE